MQSQTVPAIEGSRRGARDASRSRLADTSDAALVTLALEKRQDAWEALVHRFSGLVAGIARRHRLPASDAADVAQVTWLQLYRHLARLRDPASVGAWISRTARHECLRIMATGQHEVPDGGVHEGCERARGNDPLDAVLAMERRAAVRSAVRRLPQKSQDLLTLLVWDERPYDRVTEIMGIARWSVGPTRERCQRRLASKPEIAALA